MSSCMDSSIALDNIGRVTSTDGSHTGFGVSISTCLYNRCQAPASLPTLPQWTPMACSGSIGKKMLRESMELGTSPEAREYTPSHYYFPL